MGSTALYLFLDRCVLDAAGWSAFDDACHHMDAPDWIPQGSTTSWQSKPPYVAREWEVWEQINATIEEFMREFEAERVAAK